MSLTRQVIGGRGNASSSVACYCPLFGGREAQTNSRVYAEGIASTNGTLKNLYVELSGTPGTGNHYDITLYKNGVATALTVEIAGSNTINFNMVDEVSISAGDYLVLVVIPTSNPTGRTPTYTLDFIPTTAGETLLLSATYSTAPAVNDYIPVIGGNSSSTEFNTQVIIPCSGTVKNLYIRSDLAAGSGKSLIYTVRKNGVNQSLEVTLSGDTQKTGNDTSNSFTVAAGDKLSIQRTGDSVVANDYLNTGLCFIPDTLGYFPALYLAGTNVLNTTGTQYNAVDCNDVWGTTETTQDQRFPVSTFKNLYVELSGAPDNGAGTQAFTFTLRKSQTSQGLAVTISELATSGNATADVSIANYNSVDTMKTITGTPASNIKALVSYTVYIVPIITYVKIINSDAKIKGLDNQKGILSDTKIQVLDNQKTIDSDSKVVDKYQEEIDSDAKIKVIDNQKNILSDSKIKVFNSQKTTISDALITSITQKEINSDAKIKIFDNQKNIFSDAKIILINQETILSDSKILVIGTQKNLLSNAKIVIQILNNFINKINTVQGILSDINNKFNTVKRILSNINNFINICKLVISDIVNDFRTQKLTLNNIANDIRFMYSWQKAANGDIQSLGKTYIKVYIGGIEQTDIDIDSINISKDLNTSHTATFDLCRVYDAAKPAMESTVSIKYNNWILFSGYITQISPADNPEKIRVNCQDEYWKQNKSNVYYHVGHKPQDNKELYYETPLSALISQHGWNPGIGNFIPETIDNFAIGKSEAITKLIDESGNYKWFYDVNGIKILWTAGNGSIININRQSLGTNIKLYDLLSHSFSEDSENVVNKLRVQMGNKVIRKLNSTGGDNSYTAENNSSYFQFVTPVWDESLELLSSETVSGYGYDHHNPEIDENEYGKVFTTYEMPFLDPELSSWSDEHPPYVEVYYISNSFGFHLWGGAVGSQLGLEHLITLTEGFTIDYQNGLLKLNQPIYAYETDWNGECIGLRALILKVFLWKTDYYTVTDSPSENPEEDISNPLMFFTDKMGTYPDTIIKDLNLSNLSIQVGGKIGTEFVPSWDDTNFAKDFANWKLTQTCDKKITGNIELTLDAICFYTIDLTKRIYIPGITETPMNIISMSYNISNFTVTVTLENNRYYNRTFSLPSHGE